VGERDVPGAFGEILWVSEGPGQLRAEYPALAELVGNLHALPFELNELFRDQAQEKEASGGSRGGAGNAAEEEVAATAGGGSGDAAGTAPPPPLGGLRLTVALPASTALLRLRPGCRQPRRVDCDTTGKGPGCPGGGDNDSGHRVSALYFLPPLRRRQLGSGKGDAGGGGGNFGGVLRLQNVAAARDDFAGPTEGGGLGGALAGKAGTADGATEVAPAADRLVLWRSDLVSNERSTVVAASDSPGGVEGDGLGEEADLYALVFWMHGVDNAAVAV
jgi:hypothetical protein